MCIAALFTIAKTRKQPKHPSADEWIKKMWCIYTQWVPWRRAWQPTQPTLVFLPGGSPWTEEPGGLQSRGLQRVRHDERLSTLLNHKKNGIMPFAATWIDLEIIILNEISQTKANTISPTCGIWFFKSDTNELMDLLWSWNSLTDTKNTLMVTRGERWGYGG